MIELLPTPKNCEVVDEKRHALARTVCTKVAEWQPALEAFCESFAKIFECEMQKGVCGGVELVRDDTLAKNAYKLDSTGALRVFASDIEGLNYGLATALQLLRVTNGEAAVPAVRIEDRPDKDFRAFMIDVGFCWQPFDKMLKYIDLCHLYKINHLHMHISDAAGYSLPSKAFPKLPNKGKHYSFEQVAELNRYAAARGVKLVPEFECPGHATALNRAYPEVFSNHADGEGAEMYNELGAKIESDALVCAGSDEAFEGVKVLLKEIADMFPDAPYIHIGGDEAPHQQWEQCAACRAYMKKHNIASTHELYSEYVGRVAAYVLSLGKTPMVWEGFPKESSHYVPKETVVIAWESHYQLATELLENGFRITNASWQPLYLVTSLSKRWGPEDILNWNVYNWQHWWPNSVAKLNPITIPPTDDLLGATLCSWGLTYDQHISRLLENFPAFAERTWTVRRVLDYDTYRKVFNGLCYIAARLVQDR